MRRARWECDSEKIRQIREIVFVIEQQVPVELEWDGLDPTCLHVVAEAGAGIAIGTGRLLPDGHIGRMAVLGPWRRKGVGGLLLDALMSAASERGFTEVVLNAQTHAINFYAQHGFTVEGDAFSDAGIPHRRMRRTLR